MKVTSFVNMTTRKVF